MSFKLRTGLLIRVISVIAGIGLVAYAARRSVVVTAAVLVTMAGLFMATKRRKRRSRYKGPSNDIAIVAALTLLIWVGIAAAFKIADSSDPELLAVSFSGGLTIASIAMVSVLTVMGASVAWYSFANEQRSRRSRRSGRTTRQEDPDKPKSSDHPAEAS